MRLAELLQGRADAGAAGDILVHGLAIDSRDVREGDAFVALAGSQAHGITFAPAASARGAAVVLAEAPGAATSAPMAASMRGMGNGEERGMGNGGSGIVEAKGQSESGSGGGAPVVWVEGLRERLGAIASHFFGEPSQALKVVGVTGTNGKTSTEQLLTHALAHARHRVASIGTHGAALHTD
jgi:UDP-N-acetylmuramoyl-L-alanyl-D-glutamate--2,6-diaminopimelate ligase